MQLCIILIMISKKIEEFAKTISFTVNEDSAFGEIDGFLVSVFEKKAKKSFFVYYILEEKSMDESIVSVLTISGKLSDVFSKYSITDYSVKENGIEISCTLSFVEFYSLIKETVLQLSKIHALKKNICSQCLNKIEDDESHFRICNDEKNSLICKECASSYNEPQEDEENEGEKSDFTVKGILGSLLFSLGGAICLVLLYCFVVPITDNNSSFRPGYYANWVCAIVALASFFGYKIFSKNPKGNKPLLISGGVALVISAITQYLCSIILFIREKVLVFENLTSEKIQKMIPSLLKIPFTDKFVSPDFKIYILMDAIFIVVALLVISFYTAPKEKNKTIIAEIK